MALDATTRDAMVSPVVTHLHLLRHGETDVGERRLAYGSTDLPLSARGRVQSAALLTFAEARLPRPDTVFSSDLRRCLDLAEPLAERLGVPLVVSPALREQHMGAWEGQAWEDLQLRHDRAINTFWADYLHGRPPGGESFTEVGERIGRWWAEVAPRLEGGRHVVVGHIGVIRALTCQLLGLPLAEALRLAPPHGSHTQLLWAESGGVLQALGERPGVEVPAAAPQYQTAPVRRSGGRRIALCGSAGTGKTTLGTALAQVLGLPFIEEGMRRRLERGLTLHVLTRDDHRALLSELWEEQIQAEAQALADAGGFVSDRSAVDFAAFALAYQFYDDEAWTRRFLEQTLGHAGGYDGIVLLPWGVLPLQADGIRSPNRLYQRHVQAVMEGLLRREVEPGRAWVLPGIVGLEERIRWVEARIGA